MVEEAGAADAEAVPAEAVPESAVPEEPVPDVVAPDWPARLAIGVRRLPFGDRLVGADRAWLVVTAMVVAWIAVFAPLVWQRHSRFGSFSFDLGIFDQAVWLLSRPPFGDGLITVRGLTVFGHHAEPALYLLAPFYWLGAGPQFLNMVQVVSMALGAVPLFLIARDRLGYGWIALPVCVAYLLHPALGFMAWELFHP
ncbi:MAG: DUF2079 domain-containing protein, partial [Acidimicrobiales bacterium]